MPLYGPRRAREGKPTRPRSHWLPERCRPAVDRCAAWEQLEDFLEQDWGWLIGGYRLMPAIERIELEVVGDLWLALICVSDHPIEHKNGYAFFSFKLARGWICALDEMSEIKDEHLARREFRCGLRRARRSENEMRRRRTRSQTP